MIIKIPVLPTDSSIYEILERNGYTKKATTKSQFNKLLVIPEVSCRSHVFSKDNKSYVFIGWESDDQGLIKTPAKYIEILEVNL